MNSTFSPANSLFAGLIDAHSDEAFANGYRRAINDVLALQPLLVEQFLRMRELKSPETQASIRALPRYLEAQLDSQASHQHALDATPFGEGLGI